MKKLNYNTAVDYVLRLAGFVRDKQFWRRFTDDFVDMADVKISSNFEKVTINLQIVERRTFEIYSGQPADAETRYYHCPVDRRLNMIITEYDRWWPRGDPETPSLMLEAIRDHGLPYFDKMHSLEAMETHIRKVVAKPWRDQRGTVFLAITLCRMGRIEEALDLIKDPPAERDYRYSHKEVEVFRQRILAEARRQAGES